MIFWLNFVFVPKQTQLKSLNVIRTLADSQLQDICEEDKAV